MNSLECKFLQSCAKLETMIELHKINGAPVFVNPDLIRLIEKTPDTVLTFTDGEKLMVRDKPDEIVEKVVRFRRRCAVGFECVDTKG
jgi:flagellar protein FlbD